MTILDKYTLPITKVGYFDIGTSNLSLLLICQLVQKKGRQTITPVWSWDIVIIIADTKYLNQHVSTHTAWDVTEEANSHLPRKWRF